MSGKLSLLSTVSLQVLAATVILYSCSRAIVKFNSVSNVAHLPCGHSVVCGPTTVTWYVGCSLLDDLCHCTVMIRFFLLFAGCTWYVVCKIGIDGTVKKD